MPRDQMRFDLYDATGEILVWQTTARREAKSESRTNADLPISEVLPKGEPPVLIVKTL